MKYCWAYPWRRHVGVNLEKHKGSLDTAGGTGDPIMLAFFLRDHLSDLKIEIHH